MLFTDSMMLAPVDTVLNPSNYLAFTDAKFKELKDGWFRMEKEYVATGNYRAVVIGNFSTENYVEITKNRGSGTSFFSVKVDNVEIIPFEKVSCSGCSVIKDSLYSITKRHYPTQAIDTMIASKQQIPLEDSSKITDSIELSDVLFKFGTSNLNDTTSLIKFAKVLSDKTVSKIEILGYTDDVGDKTFNLKLSEKRAQEVGKIISAMFNTNPSIMVIKGMGISTKYRESHKNRRVDILIYR